MNVLSCFDGMSCGQIALHRANISYAKYYASEIDKHAICVTQSNYPNTIQLGDVKYVRRENLPQIDLLLGGSPCQGFSSSGKKLNFNDPRSVLFFEYVRLLKECNPKYFLLENVVMQQEHINVISSYMGVKPVMIDSAMFSAQSRKRLYWTNIDFALPTTISNLIVSDIMDNNVDGKYLLSNSYNLKNSSGEYRLIKLYMNYRNNLYISNNKPMLVSEIANETPSGRSRQTDRLYSSNAKSPTLLASRAGDIKFDCGTNDYTKWRNLTPIEAERLQTLDDNYTSSVSDNQRYKMIGNGWTVDVVAHILKGIK